MSCENQSQASKLTSKREIITSAYDFLRYYKQKNLEQLNRNLANLDVMQSTIKVYLRFVESADLKLLEKRSQEINLLQSKVSSDSFKDQLDLILEMKNSKLLEVLSNSTEMSNKNYQEKSSLKKNLELEILYKPN